MELTMSHFNALQAFDRLKESGISENQARAIVQTVEECSAHNLEAAATKGDILRLEGQINELKISMNWLQRLFFGSTFLILINIAINFLHH